MARKKLEKREEKNLSIRLRRLNVTNKILFYPLLSLVLLLNKGKKLPSIMIKRNDGGKKTVFLLSRMERKAK